MPRCRAIVALIVLAGCAGSLPPKDKLERLHPESASYPACEPPALTDEELDTALAQATHVVRGRVTEWGSTGQRNDSSYETYSYAIVEVLEYLKGSAADVLPAYRSRFPLFARAYTRHEDGTEGNAPPTMAGALSGQRGREYLLFVQLPTERGFVAGGVPPALRATFGPYEVGIGAIQSSSEEPRLRAKVLAKP